jgi:SAM-dependent methyltransferase
MVVVRINSYFRKKSWKIRAQQNLPYLPTPYRVIEVIFDTLKSIQILSRISKMVDLGAGDGRVICYIAEKYGIHATGLEINTDFINEAQTKIEQRNLSTICEIIEADFYNFDLSGMNLIYCFIFPSTLQHFEHVIKNLQSGVYIVSVRWSLSKLEKYLKKLEVINPMENFSVYIYQKL